MPSLPSLAIVIPCRDSERWLRRAIDSVLAQGADCAELIVIDDGSTDRSLDVVRSYGERLSWRSGPGRGACAARNAGLALATADYVMFLDADDYVEGPLLAGVRRSAADGRPDLVVSRWTTETKGVRTDAGPVRTPAEAKREFLRYNVQTASLAFERRFLDRIGGWNDAVLLRQDVEVALRALLHQPRIAVNPEGIAVWVSHPGHAGVSRRDDRAAWASVLGWYDDHCRRLGVRSDPEFAGEYAARYYHLASRCYTRGWADLGDEALRSSRALGLRGHLGDLRHRVLSRVFGLRRRVTVLPAAKRRLRAAIRRIRRAQA
ncbi:MAG: glycosyltransferase family 2 protein [Bauldia sp.]|nr:glycosyltransferase family 2 protein [Bauldia sp.]